mmetsp:Transcript_15473/g.48837  ORF Transcript_15473/g.48837 Transcript_15473/m.48837 type:complete len:220 (+) Transcript_15473:1383-2042(+)
MHGHTAQATLLSLAEGVVHGLAPAVRDLRVPGGLAEVLRLLQGPEPLPSPVLDGLGSWREEVAALRHLLADDLGHVEAADGEAVPRGHVPVGHQVRPEEHHGAGQCLHLVRLRLQRAEGLQHQAAGLGPQENDGHELVPQELGLPLGDLKLREARCLLLRLPSLMQYCSTPVSDIQANVIEVRFQDVPHSRHGMVHCPQVLALLARLVVQVRIQVGYQA